jgi:hypothetical protein
MDQFEAIQNLLSWADASGTSLHQNVEIYQDQLTGLSFKAKERIDPETKLVDCSPELSLSCLNAFNYPNFPRHGEALPLEFLYGLMQMPHVIGNFFLIQQYLMGPKSFWWPYIRLLPQPDGPSDLPMLWPEEDRIFLEESNAQTALKLQRDRWEDEWKHAIAIPVGQDGGKSWNWKEYTITLYLWAATIFGSRSFGSRGAVAEILVSGQPWLLKSARQNNFAVLLPVLDIGNHNGRENLKWVAELKSGRIVLSNRDAIAQNCQIYNHYGNKFNSELLVSYGFILVESSLANDAVNIQLKPPPEALLLRKSQTSYVPPQIPAEELIFRIRPDFRPFSDQRQRIEEFKAFSDGFFNLYICMRANKRETRYIVRHPYYNPESDPNVLGGHLARCIMEIFQELSEKAALDVERISRIKLQ